jgi:hypothetical protein
MRTRRRLRSHAFSLSRSSRTLSRSHQHRDAAPPPPWIPLYQFLMRSRFRRGVGGAAAVTSLLSLARRLRPGCFNDLSLSTATFAARSGRDPLAEAARRHALLAQRASRRSRRRAGPCRCIDRWRSAFPSRSRDMLRSCRGPIIGFGARLSRKEKAPRSCAPPSGFSTGSPQHDRDRLRGRDTGTRLGMAKILLSVRRSSAQGDGGLRARGTR